MKKIKLWFFVGFAIASFPFLCNAQNNSRGYNDTNPMVLQNHKVQTQHVTRKQKLLFRKPNVRHTARYEYYARLEQIARKQQRIALKKKLIDPRSAEFRFYVHAEEVAKEKQHMLREMARPQFSDFSYFGHKRPPKKHLPYAMRYCKECGIRH